jgi:hypothetical protein
MSQHDLNIANQGFPAFRADLNDALVALGSTNSGATAPATTFANQLWYDTANNILKIRNEDNDAWISIATLDQSGDLVSAIGSTTLANLVSLAGTETLTNKTLTSPAINGQTVDKITDTQGGVFTPSSAVMRNRIINGAMTISQRNGTSSFSSSANGAYNLDRWYNQNNSGGTRFTVQQDAGAVTPPVGFTDYLGVTSTSAYSVASTDVLAIGQKIEGFNTADLAFGTASAKTITLSFWVRSSLTGTFGGSLSNNDGNRFYAYTYTISSANTWEYKTITITGDITGTWNTTNGAGIQLLFNLGTGATYSGAAGSWTDSPFYAPTGATSVVGTNGATFYITGVQLERGTQATSFEYRQYGTEFSLCQRYYEVMNQSSIIGICDGTNVIICPHTYVVPKRATASLSLLNTVITIVEPTVSARVSSGATFGGGTGAGISSCTYQIVGFSSLTGGRAILGAAGTVAVLGISAEI